MILTLNEDWRIATDQWNYILQKRGHVVKTGKDAEKTKWISEGFYPSIQSAVQSFTERSLRLSDADGVQSILDEVKRLEGALMAAIERHFTKPPIDHKKEIQEAREMFAELTAEVEDDPYEEEEADENDL